MRAFALFLFCCLTAVMSCSTPVDNCICSACNRLIDLQVVDINTGETINGFIVETEVDGVTGEPDGCEFENGERDICTFGRTAGVYDLVIRAPGYQQLEMVTRVPGEGGGICCTACLDAMPVLARMTPNP